MCPTFRAWGTRSEGSGGGLPRYQDGVARDVVDDGRVARYRRVARDSVGDDGHAGDVAGDAGEERAVVHLREAAARVGEGNRDRLDHGAARVDDLDRGGGEEVDAMLVEEERDVRAVARAGGEPRHRQAA